MKINQGMVLITTAIGLILIANILDNNTSFNMMGFMILGFGLFRLDKYWKWRENDKKRN